MNRSVCFSFLLFNLIFTFLFLFDLAHASEEENKKKNPSPQDRSFTLLTFAVQEQIKSLEGRVLSLRSSSIDYEDETLKKKLSSLGCLSVGIIDVPEVTATVILFPHGVASRIVLNRPPLQQQFAAACSTSSSGSSRIEYHQHEAAKNVPPKGTLNTSGVCSPANTGGHHDPGFACGATGTTRCKQFNLPASLALEGTSFHTGEYSCSPSVYASRPFACHAGDISGKLGGGVDVSPDPNKTDLRLFALDWHADNPCVASDLQHSLVLHCHPTNFRFACGRFHRLEAAGKELPQLLLHVLRTAVAAAPHVQGAAGLLSAFVFAQEAEKRVELLEKAAAKARNA